MNRTYEWFFMNFANFVYFQSCINCLSLSVCSEFAIYRIAVILKNSKSFSFSLSLTLFLLFSHSVWPFHEPLLSLLLFESSKIYTQIQKHGLSVCVHSQFQTEHVCLRTYEILCKLQAWTKSRMRERKGRKK